MLPDLPPQPELEAETMQVSDAAHCDSEWSIEDFEISTNNLVLRLIPLPIMAIHIFNCLSSVIVNTQQALLALVFHVKEQEN